MKIMWQLGGFCGLRTSGIFGFWGWQYLNLQGITYLFVETFVWRIPACFTHSTQKYHWQPVRAVLWKAQGEGGLAEHPEAGGSPKPCKVWWDL